MKDDIVAAKPDDIVPGDVFNVGKKCGEVMFSVLMFVDFSTNLLKLLLGQVEKDPHLQVKLHACCLP